MLSWFKRLLGDAPETPSAPANSPDTSDTPTPTVHDAIAPPLWPDLFEAPHLQVQADLLDWQDKWMFEISRRALLACHDTQDAIAQALLRRSWKDRVTKNTFFERDIQPLLEAQLTQFSERLNVDMQADWRQQLKSPLTSRAMRLATGLDIQGASAGEMLGSATPFAAAAVAVPLVANASVVSAAGLMGFLGATAVSWPIVAGGAVLVGGLAGLGVFKTSKLFEASDQKLAKQLEAHVAVLFMHDPNGNSLAQRHQQHVFQTVQQRLAQLTSSHAHSI